VRTGASSLDDSIGGSGRELLNTEKRMFNSGSETEGIVEISCDTIAVVSFSSSSPPPNHVIFNIGAALCGSSLICTVTLSNCHHSLSLTLLVDAQPAAISCQLTIFVKQLSRIWQVPFLRCA
jgi:hypothetical protein